MKKTILLALFLSTSVFATTLDITKMTLEENFELRFLLEGTTPNTGHIILDCQSYFQKVDFFDGAGTAISENVISINECEYLYDVVNKCLLQNKVKCFDTDHLFNDECGCD